jgi:uncharacterized phage-associated protein
VIDMPINALAIANAFIDEAKKHNESVSPMKLQKLVYFANGWYLALFDEPLLDEMVEAWEYGPVIPSVYHEFKKFGNNSITKKATTIDYPSLNFREAVIPDLGNRSEIEELIVKIWEVYGDLTAIQIANLTHQDGTPWEETVSQYKSKYSDSIPKNLDIDREIIKQYFTSKLETPNE